MFNLLNLDSLEFEKFCLDFMEKKTNKKFKRFGSGKDNGTLLKMKLISYFFLNNKICKQLEEFLKFKNKVIKNLQRELILLLRIL